MTAPTPNDNLAGALAEGFARALNAPMNSLVNTVAAQRQELAAIEAALLRLAVGVEGILERLTPESERPRVYQVGSYVRSANNGGDLVYLYATHPGLEFKVATVYSEDFPHLRPFLDPAVGRIYDGEGALKRDAAAKKGYLQECTPFEIVLRPTGKTTDAGLPTYDFEAARSLTSPEPAPAPAHQPPAAQPAATPTPTDAERAAAAAEFDSWPSGSEGKPPLETKQPPAGPRVSAGAASSNAPATAGPPTTTQSREDAPAYQATVVGDAYAPFTKFETDFARRYPYYRRKNAGEAPDSYRIRVTLFALGKAEDGKSSRFAKITTENLAAACAALEAHAAAQHPAR